MPLVCVAILIIIFSAFFHIRNKRRNAFQRYAVAFTQWEAEWSGNGLQEHEDTHNANAIIQVGDQSAASSRHLESGLVDHSQNMTVAASALAEKAAGQRS